VNKCPTPSDASSTAIIHVWRSETFKTSLKGRTVKKAGRVGGGGMLMYADGQCLSLSHAAYSRVQFPLGAAAAQKIKLSHEAKISTSASCVVDKGGII